METIKDVYDNVKATFDSQDWQTNILGFVRVDTVAAKKDLLDNLRSELDDGKFTLKEAVDYVSKCKYHTTVSNVQQTVTINVFTEKVADLPPILLLKRVFKRITATISILNITQKKHFVFWLVPCDKNRWFPKRGIVTPRHINGGFTYITGDQDDTVNIFIYRLEEFPKVMLHETIHHSSRDMHGLIHPNDVNRLKVLCNIHKDTQFLPNEAIVEAWAIIMHTAFLSVEYNIPYSKLLDIEKVWCEKQAERLLQYQYQNAHPHNMWKEETNSYSYIVLKSYILQKHDEFLSLSHDSKSIVNFITKVAEDISKSTTKVSESKNNKHPSKLRDETNSFRMSVFGNI